MQLVFVHRHDVADEDVLTDTPVLDELDESDFPAVAERTRHKPKTGARLALAVAGVNDHDGPLGLIILKSHCYQCSAWLLIRLLGSLSDQLELPGAAFACVVDGECGDR